MATEIDPSVPSPLIARSAGFLYLLTILTGISAQYLGGSIVVSDSASSTATNILTQEISFRLAFLADALMTVSYIAVTALFYELFRRVNKAVSVAAAFFGLVGCAIQAANLLSYAVPLFVLEHPLDSFNTEQLHSLTLLLLKAHGQAYGIALIFFGVYCALIGLLCYWSTFIPKVVGVLMFIAALGWLTYLWPPLASSLEPYNLLPGLIGEGSIALWLLVKGNGVRAK